MENIKYRVVLKISYYSAFFDFDTYEEAGKFATDAVIHGAGTDDKDDRLVYVTIKIINVDEENKQKEEQEEE